MKHPAKSQVKYSISMVKHWLSPLYLTHSNTKYYTLSSAQLRKLGLIYNTYRVVISFFLFVTLYSVGFNFNDILQDMPSKLHRFTLLSYCIISLLLFAFHYTVKHFERRQLSIGLIIDVIVMSILLYSNGTADPQIIMLYMVVVAASFMLLQPYQSFIVTLLAIIFVIYQQFFQAIIRAPSFIDITDALLLCLSFIGVAFISWAVSQRLALVEHIAATNAQELQKLNAINQEVISKMSNGVLVIDSSLNVLISNEAAINFLGINPAPTQSECVKDSSIRDSGIRDSGIRDSGISDSGISDSGISDSSLQNTDFDINNHIANTLTSKHAELAEWFKSASKFSQSQYVYKLTGGNYETDKLRLNTTPLQDGSLLVIIEDVRREQSNAQQLKLASLGQLTASIAHEIRNPLASISQASQLLIEDYNDAKSKLNNKTTTLHTNVVKNSPHVTDLTDAATQLEQNNELYQIIFKQTKRVNRIIEDVLRLSRQAKPKQTKINLYDWLQRFVNNHYDSHDVFIKAIYKPYVYFDTNQLEQILINLINNGLRFSSMAHPHAYVELVIGCEKSNAILDVLDSGNGVDIEQLPNLFHPFFTTDSQGTGLGLYLSQAFCEANHARLIYVPEHKSTCFRLIIPRATSSL